MITIRVTNSTRKSVLATHSNLATTPATRRQGLIGVSQREFTPGNGLYFPECNAIHTVEMGFPIDVLFIDTFKYEIVKAVPYAAPGCHFNVLVPKEICAVLELPPGTLEITGTRVGDRIAVMSSAHAPQADLNRIGAL